MHLIKDENGNLVHHGHEHSHEHTHENGVTHTHAHSHEESQGTTTAMRTLPAATPTERDAVPARAVTARMKPLHSSLTCFSTMSTMRRSLTRWLKIWKKWDFPLQRKQSKKALQISRRAI